MGRPAIYGEDASRMKSGVPAAALRATVRAEPPGPELRIVWPVRSGRADRSVIVPVTAGAKSIVSWLVLRSAWVIAARSEPGPESFVFITVIVLSTTRPSRGSIPHAAAASSAVAARPDRDPISRSDPNA